MEADFGRMISVPQLPPALASTFRGKVGPLVFLLSILLLAPPASAQNVTTAMSGFSVGNISRDSAGYFYLSDFVGTAPGWNNANGNLIRRVSADFTQVDTFVQGYTTPTGSIWHQGDFYFSVNGTNHVRRWNGADSSISLVASGLNSPVGLEFDDLGNLYIINFYGFEISKVDPQGNKTTFVNNSALYRCNGLTRDPDGNLYTCNWYSGAVLKIDTSGVLSTIGFVQTGNLGTISISRGAGYIKYVNGLLYVTGVGTAKVFRMDMTGNYQVVAGSGTPGYLDGPLLTAQFVEPNGLYAYPSGDSLLIGETVAKRLRLVTGVNSIPTAQEVEKTIGLSLFPVPADTELRVRFGDPRRVVSVQVRDMNGKVMEEIGDVQKDNVIDVERYPSGMYVLQVLTEEVVLSKRVTIH